MVVGACGGNTAGAPVNVHRGSGDPVVKAADNCEPHSTGWHPGNHDRFSFEDPATHKYGFKDGKGTIVIPASFPHVYEFSPTGVAGVIDGKTPFVFIDPSGKVLARAYAFDNGPDYFQEGLARIVDDANKVGFITDAGQIAIAPRFTGAAAFCHGKAEVEIDDTTFFIDRQGNKTTPPTPDP
jgi:hypothetical protein